MKGCLYECAISLIYLSKPLFNIHLNDTSTLRNAKPNLYFYLYLYLYILCNT